MKNKKEKKWIKKRHKGLLKLVYPFMLLYSKMALKLNKIDLPKGEEPCLVLYNHQTNFDPFLIGLIMGKRKYYYVASEHIFSKGFVSSLLKYFIAPVPFLKAGVNVKAIMTCGKIVKEGGSIIISPEGNRTYTGETTEIKPVITKFVRFLKIPLVLVNITGNYAARPRWAKSKRQSEVKVEPVKIIQKEEYDKLTDQELLSLIRETLYVNESDDGVIYVNKRKNNAEYLERFLCVCPDCGLTHFYSKGNQVSCTKCGKTATFLNSKRFEGAKFSTLKAWGDYQKEYLVNLPIEGDCLIKDKITLSKTIREKRNKVIYKNVNVLLYADKISIKGKDFIFKNVDGMSVVGDNLLYVHYGDEVYRIKGDKRFNAVKYLILYEDFKNREINDDNR